MSKFLLPFVLTLCLTGSVAAQVPDFSAELIAERETVAAGDTVTVAVRLEIAEDWHIYHPIILDTGFGTTVEWELPDGVSASPVRFPEPYLGSVEIGDTEDEYLELSEEIVLLSEVTVPAGASGSLELKANVSALACKQSCIPVNASAGVTLKVAPEAGPKQKSAFFEEARDALPTRLAEAEFITGSKLTVEPTKVGLNQRGILTATITVKKDHHVQHVDPGVDSLIPTRLLLEPSTGVEFVEEDEQIWTKPHTRDVPNFGRVREQSGTFTIQVPFEITDEDLPPGKIPVRALLQYQCCADSGQCFQPMMAADLVLIDFDPKHKGSDAPPTPQPEDSKDTDGPAVAKVESEPTTPQGGLLSLLGFAFLGGVILNIMPCVLPVISLKIMGFVSQAGDDRARIFKVGLVYALGILVSFFVLAVVMSRVGAAWGSQMQEPRFLIGLSAVVFVFALNLLGVFEIQLPGAAMSAAGNASQGEGYGAAFMNGLLTTALATPCTAPVLGSAAGLLLQYPPLTQFFGIMMVGVGLAAPYVLLSAFPQWLKLLPKPGPWMVTFKQLVGFVMFAVVVWLLSALIKQVEPWVFLGTLGLFVGVGMGCWWLGRLKLTQTNLQHAQGWVVATVLVVAIGWGSFRFFEPKGQIPWQQWEPGLATRLAGEGYTVYVDYTADWCLTCQQNKAGVLETDTIRARLGELDVIPIKADFTKKDSIMLKEIRSYTRNGIQANGVPLNIIIPAGAPQDAIVLPELLTQNTVLDALKRAGKSEQRPTLAKK